jgi:glutamine cyclotransferase
MKSLKMESGKEFNWRGELRLGVRTKRCIDLGGLLWQMRGGAAIPGVFCFPLMLVRTDFLRKILLRLMVAAQLFSPDHAEAAPIYGYRVVATFPHSTESYTEGFFYLDGIFYEGIGINGHSAILAVAPETGRIFDRHDLPPEYFGEEIVDCGPYVYEWTWKSHVCFAYDRFSLQVVKRFTYAGEGWGMTGTAKELITSDGTATLRFRDPETFRETRHIAVKDGSKVIRLLQ